MTQTLYLYPLDPYDAWNEPGKAEKWQAKLRQTEGIEE